MFFLFAILKVSQQRCWNGLIEVGDICIKLYLQFLLNVNHCAKPQNCGRKWNMRMNNFEINELKCGEFINLQTIREYQQISFHQRKHLHQP